MERNAKRIADRDTETGEERVKLREGEGEREAETQKGRDIQLDEETDRNERGREGERVCVRERGREEIVSLPQL